MAAITKLYKIRKIGMKMRPGELIRSQSSRRRYPFKVIRIFFHPYKYDTNDKQIRIFI